MNPANCQGITPRCVPAWQLFHLSLTLSLFFLMAKISICYPAYVCSSAKVCIISCNGVGLFTISTVVFI